MNRLSYNQKQKTLDKEMSHKSLFVGLQEQTSWYCEPQPNLSIAKGKKVLNKALC